MVSVCIIDIAANTKVPHFARNDKAGVDDQFCFI
jgi:hypothetical protein